MQEASSAAGAEAEDVERRLAQYTIVREEREGEVRLLFRDLPAPEMAMSFRAAGAAMISIGGERAPSARSEVPDESAHDTALTTEIEPLDIEPAEGRPGHREGSRKRRKHSPLPPPTGELLLRYFFSLGNTVYTVSLPAPSGVVGSVAGIYPAARVPEEQLRERLNVIFT